MVLGARLFGEMIRRMPDGIVSVTVDEKDNVNIKCGKSEYNIIGISPDDYPEMPKFDAVNNISLPQNILKDHAGVEHERLRFDRVNAIEVPKEIADWLIDNDAFAVAD